MPSDVVRDGSCRDCGTSRAVCFLILANPIVGLSCKAACTMSAIIVTDIDGWFGLSVGESDGKEEKARRTQALTEMAFQSVTAEYKSLVAAMHDPAVRDASGGVYTQPWKN